MLPQVEDRVADQLAGPVVGHLSAATDAHAPARPPPAAAPRKRGIGPAAERVDGRVLEQQQDVGATGEPPRLQRLLPGERGLVGHPPAARHLEVHARIFRAGTHGRKGIRAVTPG